MKEDYHKTSISVKCNDNNTFDAIKTWPECISSMYRGNEYISGNDMQKNLYTFIDDKEQSNLVFFVIKL